MTSQLNVDTIVDKAGSGGTNVKVANTSTYVSEGGLVTQNVVQGLAKAFISIDVSEAAAFSADDSFNIASVTDAATGVFTIAYTNAMKTSRYPAPAGCYTTGGDSINTRGENTTGTSLNMAAADGSASDIDSYVVITGTMA
jgi:hypothetical protein